MLNQRVIQIEKICGDDTPKLSLASQITAEKQLIVEHYVNTAIYDGFRPTYVGDRPRILQRNSIDEPIRYGNHC